MSYTFNILIVGAFFCILMLLVLSSLLRSGLAGIREWLLANALACVALVLYAFGRELPPLIAYEVANGVYGAATAAMLAGFLRFLGRDRHVVLLAAGVALLVAAVAVFHYVHDSFALRTVAVAAHQAAICAAIVVAIARCGLDWRSHYPYLFTAAMAVIVAVGHTVRSIIYLTHTAEVTSLLQPSPWNLFFVSAGTFVLPVLTFGAVMMVHDTMLARAESAANHDHLTGALSRRGFFDAAGREIQRANRTGRPLSLLMLDVDHFKRINDTYGHSIGDQVLADLALHARATLRGTDYFARIGGEEFVALLPETEIASAEQVAERLRMAVRNASASGTSRMHQSMPAYTISIGVSALRREESVHDLLRRADTALYAAKAMGRNRAVSETDDESLTS